MRVECVCVCIRVFVAFFVKLPRRYARRRVLATFSWRTATFIILHDRTSTTAAASSSAIASLSTSASCATAFTAFTALTAASAAALRLVGLGGRDRDVDGRARRLRVARRVPRIPSDHCRIYELEGGDDRGGQPMDWDLG